MRTHLFYFILSCIIACLALVAYGFWYAIVVGESADVARLEEQIDMKLETVQRVTAARAALAQVTTDEEVIQSHFLSEGAIVSFIDSLESSGVTKQASVEVQSVSRMESSPVPTFKFAIEVQGPFDAVMRTIGAIEHAPYAVSITNLSVTKRDKNWSGDFTMTVGSTRLATTTSP